MPGLTNPYPLLQALGRQSDIENAQADRKNQALQSMVGQLGAGLRQRGANMREDELLARARAERDAERQAALERWNKDFQFREGRARSDDAFRSADDARADMTTSAGLAHQRWTRDQAEKEAQRRVVEEQRKLALGNAIPHLTTPIPDPFGQTGVTFPSPDMYGVKMNPEESLALLQAQRSKLPTPITPYQRESLDVQRLAQTEATNRAQIEADARKATATPPAYRPATQEQWREDREFEAKIKSANADPKLPPTAKAQIRVLEGLMREAIKFDEPETQRALSAMLQDMSNPETAADAARAFAEGYRLDPVTGAWSKSGENGAR